MLEFPDRCKQNFGSVSEVNFLLLLESKGWIIWVGEGDIFVCNHS